MSPPRAVLILAATLLATEAVAETMVFPTEPSSVCASPRDRTARVDRAIESLRFLTDRIERVPPADDAYLKSEISAAMEQQNSTRFNIAAAQPMYRPWQVWQAHDKILTDLESIRDTQDARVTIIGVGRALTLFPDFVDALNDYIEFDRQRTPPVYDFKRYHFDKAVLSANLGTLLECSALSIRK